MVLAHSCRLPGANNLSHPSSSPHACRLQPLLLKSSRARSPRPSQQQQPAAAASSSSQAPSAQSNANGVSDMHSSTGDGVSKLKCSSKHSSRYCSTVDTTVGWHSRRSSQATVVMCRVTQSCLCNHHQSKHPQKNWALIFSSGARIRASVPGPGSGPPFRGPEQRPGSGHMPGSGPDPARGADPGRKRARIRGPALYSARSRVHFSTS